MADFSQKIYDVPRPDNTKIQKLSDGTIGVYEYIEVDGKKTVGRLVGYIKNYQYIPLREDMLDNLNSNTKEPYMVSFGTVALILSVSLNFLISLIENFTLKVGTQIFVVACLKILEPNLTEASMRRVYTSSYLSVAFPGVPLSKNTVAKLYHDVGLDEKSRKAFIQSLLSYISESSIIYIDGSLRQFNSDLNFLSKIPYQKKYKGYSVINVMNAFVESKNILFSDVYPGSSSDTSIFKKFLVDNLINKGILVGDAAFVPSIVRKLIEEDQKFSDLKYIGLLRSNDKRIKELDLLTFEGVFDSAKGKVLYKKVNDEKNKVFYYAFRNIAISHRQEEALLNKLYLNSNNDLNFKDKYSNSKDLFGIRIIESNLDLDVEDIYEILLKRWIIETIFQKQKSDLDLNSTRVHDVFSVIGQNFINSITTIIYQKVCERIKEAGLLKNTTYKNILEKLKGAWRKITDDEREHVKEDTNWIFNEGKPTTNDGSWAYITKGGSKILEGLGLCNPNPIPNLPNPDNNKKTRKNSSISNSANKESNTNQKKGKSQINEEISEYVNTIIQYFHNAIDTLKKSYPFATNISEEKTESFKELNNTNTSNNVNIGRPQGSLNTKTLVKNKIIKSIYESIENLLNDLNSINEQIKKLNNISISKNKGIKSDSNQNKFEDQVCKEGLDPSSAEGKERINQLKVQYESTKLQEAEKERLRKKQETLEFEAQIKKEGLDPASIEGKKRINSLRRERKAAQTGKQPGKIGRPKSQETLKLEAQVKEEGLDPTSDEGKKRIDRLKREHKATQKGKQLGKTGRPKSQETLDLEVQVREEGLDPASNEGKNRINSLRRKFRTTKLKNLVKTEGLDPESTEGKKRIAQLRYKHTKSQEINQSQRVGRPKSQETLDLEEQIKSEGIDLNSTEGKKRLRHLRYERRAAQAGRQLGKIGRPKSQKTLEFEAQVKNEGIDPSSIEGRRYINRLRREFRSAQRNNLDKAI